MDALSKDDAVQCSCFLCGAQAWKILCHVDSANFSDDLSAFTLRQCDECGLAEMHPFPSVESVKNLYVSEKIFSRPTVNPYRNHPLFKLLHPAYAKYGSDDYFVVRHCCRYVRKQRPSPHKLLDIGCCTGRLLSWFKRYDPSLQVMGLDIDPDSKSKALPGMEEFIVVDDFLSHSFENQYDIITMRFVLEHLIDFKAYLRKIVDLLSPGGIFFMSTPDVESAKAKLFLHSWNMVNDPRHCLK